MGKAISFLILFILFSTLALAVEYEYRYSPYTGRLDRTRSTNQSDKEWQFENLTVDGWIHIGAETRSLFDFASTPGDLVAEGNVFVDGVIASYATPFGSAAAFFENDGDILMNSSGATLTAFNQFIHDDTEPFLDSYDGNFFWVISSTPSFAGATGEITDVINASDIRVSFASAGGATIVDATDMAYYITPHPICIFLDNGAISCNVGENPDAKFEVHIPDGQGFQGVYIEDTAGIDQHSALTIEMDGAGYDGVVPLNIFLTSSNKTDGKEAVVLLMEVDGSNVTNGDLAFIDARLIGESPTSSIDLIRADPNFSHLIHIGSADAIDAAWYNDGTTTFNATGNFTSTSHDMTIFENDDSYIYIGNTGNFTTLGIALSRFSSQGIVPLYYYCNSDGGWELIPSVVDTTAGFTVSGSVTFSNPSNRGKCNNETDGTLFADERNLTYIAIQRTRNFIVTPPIESLISISGATDLFTLEDDMINFNCVQSAPYVCSAQYQGSIYCDSTTVSLLWCDGASWQAFAETGDVTNHNSLSGIQGGKAAEYYHFTAAQHTNLILFDSESAYQKKAGAWTLTNFTAAYALVGAWNIDNFTSAYTSFSPWNVVNDSAAHISYNPWNSVNDTAIIRDLDLQNGTQVDAKDNSVRASIVTNSTADRAYTDTRVDSVDNTSSTVIIDWIDKNSTYDRAYTDTRVDSIDNHTKTGNETARVNLIIDTYIPDNLTAANAYTDVRVDSMENLTESDVEGFFSSGDGNITYSEGVFTIALLKLGEFINNLGWITISEIMDLNYRNGTDINITIGLANNSQTIYTDDQDNKINTTPNIEGLVGPHTNRTDADILAVVGPHDGTGGWTNTSTQTTTLLNVGIGTTTPDLTLKVDGEFNLTSGNMTTKFGDFLSSNSTANIISSPNGNFKIILQDP